MNRVARALAIASLAAAALFACASAPENQPFTPALPDRTTFPAVADLLDHRCGSLDCHGQVGRNLRVYGHEGLRLAPGDRPSSKPNTTSAEYDADYLSAIGVEPEVMGEVVSSGGAEPERLTLVRKARGAEDHKGGTLFQVGDAQDVCLTSWLASKTDVAACQQALATTP